MTRDEAAAWIAWNEQSYVHPDNAASLQVAEKLGMRHVADDTTGAVPVRTVMGMDLGPLA
ncbi:hypothetical protein [Isoptericola sp. NPDC019482]|uniref:hypothetical protein n=1 Tax=Isoptericola sp. NPDC019482 TaxID=3154688 RepID=UPI00347C09C4